MSKGSPKLNGLSEPPEIMLVNGKMTKVSDIVVHTFTMGDVDDPDLYAALPLGAWQDSESGKWVMEHAVTTPWWERSSYGGYHLTYKVCARLTEVDQVFYRLKFE